MKYFYKKEVESHAIDFNWWDFSLYALVGVFVFLFVKFYPCMSTPDEGRYEYLGTTVEEYMDYKKVDEATKKLTKYNYYLIYKDDKGVVHERMSSSKDYLIVGSYLYVDKFWLNKTESILIFVCICIILLTIGIGFAAHENGDLSFSRPFVALYKFVRLWLADDESDDVPVEIKQDETTKYIV